MIVRISIQFDQFSINFLLLVLKIIVRTTQKCRDLLRDKKKKKEIKSVCHLLEGLVTATILFYTTMLLVNPSISSGADLIRS